MDRIQELLSRITELSDDELSELKDLVLAEFDGAGAAGDAPVDEAIEFSKLEELAEASTAIKTEQDKRAEQKTKRAEYAARMAEFRGADVPKAAVEAPAPAAVAPAVVAEPERDVVLAGAQPDATQVPEDRKPQRATARTTVIRAGADLPGIGMGSEINSRRDLADAMVRRINTMRGIRGGDGDKLIVATANLDGMPDELRLSTSDAEGNLAKVLAVTSPQAIVAAGGLGAPEEARYDLFSTVGSTDRPVKNALPSFVTQRGGIRFMRPPTLNDVNGVVGIWTVADDIDALTDITTRKPSFRVLPGPEVVVDTQAVTLIMTFGNMMSRAYPELVARHTDLAEVAHARIAEQQLLTQLGALSTRVKTGAQKVGAVREVLMQMSKAAASYRNRHRMTGAVPLKAFMPMWFLDLLVSDIVMQHPGDGLEVFAVANAQVEGWFRSRNINITWTLDGEAGQDYTSLTSGVAPNFDLADYPETVIWYLFAEGTFAFMDGGTLDLGLVRDSTLNAANDYQMFMETFENVVKFGHESLRITSTLVPTGQGTADVALDA